MRRNMFDQPRPANFAEMVEVFSERSVDPADVNATIEFNEGDGEFDGFTAEVRDKKNGRRGVLDARLHESRQPPRRFDRRRRGRHRGAVMSLIDRQITQSILYSDLKPDARVWIGAAPDEKRIDAEIERRENGGLRFWVINGAWGGVLYEQVVTYENGEVSNVIYIIDDRGVRHEPVYLVEMVEPKSTPGQKEGEVPF